jgi:hypothetical protein
MKFRVFRFGLVADGDVKADVFPKCANFRKTKVSEAQSPAEWDRSTLAR